MALGCSCSDGGYRRHCFRILLCCIRPAFCVLNLAQPSPKAVFRKQFGELFAVFRAPAQIVGVHVERHIRLHRDQLAPHRQPVQRLPQVVADRALDLAGACDQRIQIAEFGQPFDRRLRPHLGHARHVVDGIADQGQVIDDARRRHAELGQHAGLVEHFVGHRVDQAHLGGDQLRQILVAGRNHRLHAGGLGLSGQGADHVIRLDAVDHQQWPAERPHRFMQRRDLAGQIVRHRGAVGFVFRIPVVAEGLALGIEHAGGVGAGEILAQALQHVDDAIHRPGRLTFRIAQVGQGMEGAVEIAGAINQQEGIGHGDSK